MRDLLENIETGSRAVDPVQRAKELARRELPKRFYKEAASAESDGGFTILLDGRPIRTPGRRALVLPTKSLADHVAAEWAEQRQVIDPGFMPLTRIANTAIDGVADHKAEVADGIAAYAGNDLLCYRAEAPEGLVARQTAAWDPLLAWAETAFGGRFHLAAGVMPVAQEEAVLSAVRKALDAYSPLELAALHTVTTLTGSAVLALALAAGAASADAVWRAAHVDEDWNVEQWGEDAEAAARRRFRKAEFDAAALVLRAGVGAS